MHVLIVIWLEYDRDAWTTSKLYKENFDVSSEGHEAPAFPLKKIFRGKKIS
jgi:hypothetical protein